MNKKVVIPAVFAAAGAAVSAAKGEVEDAERAVRLILNAAKDGENPFVDPTWWPTFLKERMDMYNELMEKEPVE